MADGEGVWFEAVGRETIVMLKGGLAVFKWNRQTGKGVAQRYGSGEKCPDMDSSAQGASGCALSRKRGVRFARLQGGCAKEELAPMSQLAHAPLPNRGVVTVAGSC